MAEAKTTRVLRNLALHATHISQIATSNFKPIIKPQCSDLSRRIRFLAPLFHELLQNDVVSPPYDLLASLQQALLNADELLHFATRASQLYIILEREEIKRRFTDVAGRFEHAISKISFDELDISEEVKEQIDDNDAKCDNLEQDSLKIKERNQIFNLEDTPTEQRGHLLLLSMEDRAFAGQPHYIQQYDPKKTNRTQILQGVATKLQDAIRSYLEKRSSPPTQAPSEGTRTVTCGWFSAPISHKSTPITNIEQNHTNVFGRANSTKDHKTKWKRSHRQTCKVWGKLNVISAQEELDFQEWDPGIAMEDKVLEVGKQLIEDDAIHISLLALKGIFGSITLQLNGIIKKHTVAFLMATRSTHNVVSDKWVKSLGLKTHHLKEFPVLVASQQQIMISKRCVQLQWQFGNHEFQSDFLVRPGAHYGASLGT